MVIKNLTLKLTKLSMFMMLFYSAVLMALMEIKISNMTMLLGVITIAFMLFDMYITRFNLMQLFTAEVQALLGYMVFTFVTSILFATSRGTSLTGLFGLFQNLMLMVVTIYIILRDGNVKFCARCFVVVMLVGAFWALQNANDIFNRLTLTDSTNPNVLGHNCVCAVMLLMLFIKPKRKMHNSILLGLTCILSIVVVLSGSRMSFICLCVFFVLFFTRILPGYTGGNRVNSFLKTFFGILVLILIIYLLYPLYANTLMADRMKGLFDVFETGSGDGAARVYLYQQAWEFLKSSPIWGIGYANYATHMGGVYSHSTYAEVFACSGIVGGFLYLRMYYKMYIGLRKGRKMGELTGLILMMILLVVLLLGIGEIVFYKINYFIIFGIISGYNRLQIKSAEGR